jgi:hypothetical protein
MLGREHNASPRARSRQGSPSPAGYLLGLSAHTFAHTQAQQLVRFDGLAMLAQEAAVLLVAPRC